MLEKIVQMRTGDGVISSFNALDNPLDSIKKVVGLLESYYAGILPDERILSFSINAHNGQNDYMSFVLEAGVDTSIYGYGRFFLGFFNIWQMPNEKFITIGTRFDMMDRSRIGSDFQKNNGVSIHDASEFCRYVGFNERIPFRTIAAPVAYRATTPKIP